MHKIFINFIGFLANSVGSLALV